MIYRILIKCILVTAATVAFIIWFNKPNPLILRRVAFRALPGWQDASLKDSMKTFLNSCRTFLRSSPQRRVGSRVLSMTASDWQGLCKNAKLVNLDSNQEIKHFFFFFFIPYEVFQENRVEGLFTGYYLPLLHGSKKKTKRYNIPIYSLPEDLVTVDLGLFNDEWLHRRVIIRVKGQKALPYYSRKEIKSGAIKEKSKVVVWVDNIFDRFDMEIQGSGVVKLKNGDDLYLGYAGENGNPYTSIGKVLIDKGVMTWDSASMQAIRQYLLTHKHEMHKVLNKNKSFVFFKKLKKKITLGAQGIALTPGYSLAVDRKYIPLGLPLWLNTTYKDKSSKTAKKLQRLMIAQDTGGAIKGVVRGDVFWGAGSKASYIAGHMKNKGHYWLLLPKPFAKKLASPMVIS